MLALAEQMSHQHYIARAMNRFVEMAYLEGDWGSLRHFNDRGKAVVPVNRARW